MISCSLRACAVAVVATSAVLGSATYAVEGEMDDLLGRLMQAPAIEPAAGFAAEMLVPPGQLYDPLWLHRHDDTWWLNDDGGEEGEKGSRILSIAADGGLRVAVGLGRLLPVTGFDFAPAAFGAHAGHVYSLAQARVAAPGTTINHVIQRVDAAGTAVADVVCTLPAVGAGEKRPSGFGIDARFGPADGPFADRFFALAAYNNTIYQMDARHACTAFVSFDGEIDGSPMGLAFSADGQSMLVTLKRGGLLAPAEPGDGVVVRVHPDGQVDARPVASGLTLPGGILVAPESFAGYGGQLFVTDLGAMQSPVPMTQALAADGKLYRVVPGGEPELVASGFINPIGVQIVDGALWVTDINGDFIAGKRELPDGFIVKLTPHD